MAVRSITSSNSRFTLTIPGLFPTPRNIEGYATDDLFMVDNVQVAETMMGADGNMSAAFLPVITPLTVTLMASSPSRELFEFWDMQMKQTREILSAEAGLIQLKSIGRTYAFTNGVLQTVTRMPAAKKALQPVTFIIHWESVSPIPA